MRITPSSFLWISLAAHVAVGAAVYGRVRLTSGPSAIAPRQPEALLSGDTFEVPEELPSIDPELLPVAANETRAPTEPSRAPSALRSSPHAAHDQARTLPFHLHGRPAYRRSNQPASP